jgi:acetyl-CoA carboxylase biotin carboxylase subunit
MRVVAGRADLGSAVRLARSEAQTAFGDGAIYFERQIVSPRHVEVQVLGDRDGRVLPFVERECSIQRRHQKLVEESPSVAIADETRAALAEAAARIARAAEYTNAGTLEFLLDASGRSYFLEMNARLQVEHPVTEAVTGVDLVQWQLRLALGERVSVPSAQALTPRGHAIECRVYAEDPDRGFLPSPGLVRHLAVPDGPGVRDDRGVTAGFTVPVYYDPLISKLIVWGETRRQAIARLTRALDEYRVVGVNTTLPFFRWLVRTPEFESGRFSTTFLDDTLADRPRGFSGVTDRDQQDAVAVAACAAWLRAHRAAADVPASAGAWRRTARVESLR